MIKLIRSGQHNKHDAGFGNITHCAGGSANMIQDFSQHTALAVSYTAQYKLTAVSYKRYTIHILYKAHIMHPIQTQHTYNTH